MDSEASNMMVSPTSSTRVRSGTEQGLDVQNNEGGLGLVEVHCIPVTTMNKKNINMRWSRVSSLQSFG